MTALEFTTVFAIDPSIRFNSAADDVTVVEPSWNVPVTLTVPENVYVPVGVAEPLIGM